MGNIFMLFRAHTENGNSFTFSVPLTDYKGRLHYLETPYGIQKLWLSIRKVNAMEREHGTITRCEVAGCHGYGGIEWRKVHLTGWQGNSYYEICN